MAEPLVARPTPLRILSTSDWHLGNGRVPADAICQRLRTVLFPKLADTDILNIGGDVWDTLLNFSGEANSIVAFLIDLLRVCDRHNVVVRVLLGTYSHDRTQSSLFPVLHEKYQFHNDLRYINTVALEYIDRFDLRILYLPDDLPYTSSMDCMDMVQNLLAAKGWSYVDYVFGHGFFSHMIPSHIPRKPKCLFDVAQFTFVRRYVCMGHIHQNDLTGNVFYNNSFDRLAHGEEHPKGCIFITDHGDRATLAFLENTEATKFVTIDLSMLEDTAAIGLRYIERVRAAFPKAELGYVRVVHPAAAICHALAQITRQQFPWLHYKPHRLKSTEVHDVSHQHHALLDVKTYPVPSEDTLPMMVYEFLNKDGPSGLQLEQITAGLRGL